ncbi:MULTISPECIES: hypothetical protein [Lysinibacillus]|uniref:Uncharacterized protein n=1 Tax=Lysinibacillus fusiformis TaxID=28031 RepID=A0A1H9DYD9_9BACI|nr:hypothetical protein [Lysinibacillus fusiformis]MCG7433995.1 hypothetical protein [Lysinibacillus fusiformis]SCX48912.1 hypothetical protein SAMN02787108_01501 [Lysinibacillus fusiformis]SCY10761.1 hypothetical protein SAMN02787081_01297 [Lysinibacillus fusiformis]SDB19227.1 hypothetical protein SAMN02787070_01315 [Lysinibacillus fusiformis]SEN01066.1 hypothetical protein SAMN02787103_00788 [Lysinibacillus fusiformis]
MKKTKITALTLLVMLMMSFLLPSTQAQAAAPLEVKATAGISGKAKYQSVVPLQVTVKNNGADFSGDMAINSSNSYEAASALVVPIDIAAGEEKTFTFYLDGLADNGYSDADLFAFYEGNIEKGKKIAYKGTKRLQSNFLDPTSTFVYTLTDKSDRLSALLRLSSFVPQNNVEIFNINQLKDYTFPEDEQGLAMANVIVIDEVAIADLAQKQQAALLKWVQDGGTLLLGATDQVDATAGVFKDYLPMSLSQEMTSISAETLTKLSGGGIFTQPISIHTATNHEESLPVLTENNVVLASKKKIGSGEIIQTAFSLGDQPLASMDGYAALLAKIIDIQSISQQGMMSQGQSPLDQISYELRNINELFPSFEVSVSYMLIVIILYIIIIGPVLYFVLKKVDKREHAWWIIPVFSIVLSIGLFIVGAKDRIVQPQVQQSAFYKVNEDSSLNGYYVESILTNRSGDFIVNTDKNTTAVAMRNYNNFTGSVGDLHESSYIKENANGSTLTLRDLNYWSVQSFGGKTSAQNIGKMDVDITLKNEKLTGTIKNNFPFELKDVTLISGVKEVKLGDIKANGTLQVDKEMKTTVLQKPSVFNSYNYSYPSQKDEVDPMRVERMKTLALPLVENDRQPVLTAWTDQAIVGAELETSANMSPITMLVQPFKGKVELSGPFTMKRNNFTYSLNSLSASGYFDKIDEELNNWYLSDGLYELTMAMPDQFMDAVESLNELTISNKDVKRMQLSIWNNATNMYEPLVDTKQVFTNNIKNYINQDSEVRLEIKYGPDPTGEQTKLPEIELKGVAK